MLSAEWTERLTKPSVRVLVTGWDIPSNLADHQLWMTFATPIHAEQTLSVLQDMTTFVVIDQFAHVCRATLEMHCQLVTEESA